MKKKFSYTKSIYARFSDDLKIIRNGEKINEKD